MGIYCEINLFKPIDGTYRPGSVVSGALKYALDEETTFTAITVSLKGKGNLHAQTHAQQSINYFRKEKYVNIHNIITSEEKETTVPAGSYETKFSFELPPNIPPSFKYSKHLNGYYVKCKIVYNVYIKFERRGLMKFDKKFKKEIDVKANITPTLPMEPCIVGERKTLTQLFTRNKSIVNLTATIENCVTAPGGVIEFRYELANDTNVIINEVEMKLCEIQKFYITDSKRKVMSKVAVKDTDSKTGSVQIGDTKNMNIEIAVPLNVAGSLQNSKLVSREYEVLITAKLPIPHRNVVLSIPVQIGEMVQGVDDLTQGAGDLAAGLANGYSDTPPSYWEAMGEVDEKEEK